jgi:hypothetical protein
VGIRPTRGLSSTTAARVGDRDFRLVGVARSTRVIRTAFRAYGTIRLGSNRAWTAVIDAPGFTTGAPVVPGVVIRAGPGCLISAGPVDCTKAGADAVSITAKKEVAIFVMKRPRIHK